MEEALEMARAKDTKERMAGVERLYQLLEASRRSLSSSEVTALVDVCLDLLKDNNFRVSQGGLQALASAAVLSGEHLKIHFNALIPAVVERLGDGKQPVRDAARRFLLTLMEVSSPTIVVERAGSYAWVHKSWRVREEFSRTSTSAIGLFASTEPNLQRVVLPRILQLLNDSNHAVREASILCIEEMYTHAGSQFCDELQRHNLSISMIRDLNARLERIEPKFPSSDTFVSKFAIGEVKPANINEKKSSPKIKNLARDHSFFGGENDTTEKTVEPIKVYSEKDLIREFEKISSTLVPEKDWSIRTTAMQRVESLVCGGACDFPCFHGLLKQLIGPLSIQLSDRRSTIVKQACHLLCFLSKELLGDFEAFAEMLIPVLFKLVVITVLVIAESADNCIKTMLRNCKVARVLPRIADCAKNDRNAVLRARCCEYALLILEHWADAPEIQRAAELYEELIKCCVGDAMSEVRSTARNCYRMFSKTWPERSRRLLLSFDPVIQRVINDEDGGMHRRHASPALRERSAQLSFTSQTSALSTLPKYGTPAIVAMDRSSSLASGTSFSSGLLPSQGKLVGKGIERSLESVLHASKQKVTAIESMLKGLDISEKQHPSNLRSSLDLGVDTPASRDPAFPPAIPTSNNHSNTLPQQFNTSSFGKVCNRNGGMVLSDIITQTQASKDSSKSSYHGTASGEPLSGLSLFPARRVFERTSSIEGTSEVREGARYMNSQIDRHYLDTYKDPNYRESHNSSIPNFQRPLLGKHVSARMSASSRNSFDDNLFLLGDMSGCGRGPASLTDALNEGLSSSSDWSARVAAFTYLHSLLQHGPKGIQEVTQSFEKVMKLFFQHLDDPHHKVAQAALTTLAEIIPLFRKPFESYMERILPHVFSRLIDPKELVRQPSSITLEIVSKTYSIDSLLPALLRSLDEQRSPKAKLAVIEYATNSFNKHAGNSEGSCNASILKIWLAKLKPMVRDKNTKLKEAAITCIISVYSHFDSVSVLNFILSLSIEEQNSLRRALKQFTPRIEVDLMNFLQNKRERPRPKSSYDSSDVVGTSSEEGYISGSKKSQYFGRYSAGTIDDTCGKKLTSVQQLPMITSSINHETSDENCEHYFDTFENGESGTEVLSSKMRDSNYMNSVICGNMGTWTSHIENVGGSVNLEALSTPRLDNSKPIGPDQNRVTGGLRLDNEASVGVGPDLIEFPSVKIDSTLETVSSIPVILHLMCNGNNENSMSKHKSLQHLLEISASNDLSLWNKYFNQILTFVLEVLYDSDSSIRELALSLIIEMLKNQKDAMGDSVEILIEKLLHSTKDTVPKVSNEAEHCLTTVLSQFDPFRCLNVIVPLLASDDERTLVTFISCLTKLVGRFSQEELITQLPSFLPALFDAFGNQSADVRKAVVFCLVDIYIMLGKAFLPHLEGLNSTQVRLVTIYANRISQARTGTAVDANCP